MPINYAAICRQYADDVLSGKLIACQLVLKACTRFKRDLGNDNFVFDEREVNRVCSFFRGIKHVKGEWAGQPVKLEPWQVFFLGNVFGWRNKETGLRRFKTVYLSVARKNGKSSVLAGLGLYLTCFDREPGAEIYSAATTRDQAKIVFDLAKQMALRSKLKDKLIVYKHALEAPESASVFAPLSADYDSLDGLNIHAAIIDELHAHKSRDLYDVLDTAAGARRQPLIASISTAGYDKHSVCWQLQEYCEKILDNLIQDESTFGLIYTLDEKDKWEDEAVWTKANPNLGISVKLEDLRRQAKTAKEVPTQTNSFLCKRLNVWTESLTRWIPADKWDECATQYTEESLKGRACFAGLDLSSTKDITAFVLVFPPAGEDTEYKIVSRFFVPGDNIQKRVRMDRVPYDVWAEQGFIQRTPGDMVDYSAVLHQIQKDTEFFDLKEIVFDRWGSTMLIQTLQEMGFEEEAKKGAQRHLVSFGQGFVSMSSPTKDLEKLILRREIRHNKNPVLSWMLDNVQIRTNPAGQLKPDKASSKEKIDGVVALVMAVARAYRPEALNVYEERGIITL